MLQGWRAMGPAAPIWAGWLRVNACIAWPRGSPHGEIFTPATPIARVPQWDTPEPGVKTKISRHRFSHGEDA
jgi:hypothetical protein